MILVASLCAVGAQKVNMKWCYGSPSCAASCVTWTASDGVCYPGTNGAAAARIFVNTTRFPPRDATLIGYSTSGDCSGSITAAVFLPLDGACHAAGSDGFVAVNSAATASAAAAGTLAVVAAGALLLRGSA